MTGASGGIGSSLARALLDAGVDLVLSYSTHRENTDALISHAHQRGRRAVAVQADLADPAAAGVLTSKVCEEFGPVDILVANAGTARQADWSAVDAALWNTTMAVNLTAPFLLAQQLLPGMVDRRYGRILFVSSVAAFNGGVVGPHYAASKAGLHGLVHHLAPRVAERGITVNAIAPALVSGTGMLPIDPGRDGLTGRIPVGRLGSPTEIADMAMAMMRNGYLTNKIITLDGGLVPR